MADYGVVVKEFAKTIINGAKAIHYRILKTQKGDYFMDIREFVTAQEPGDFEGYTKKGIRLDAGELQKLIKYAGEAIPIMTSDAPAPKKKAPAKKGK